MRYLDIAVALLVGTAAMTGVTAWSPGQSDLASRRFQAQAALRDSLVAFIDSKGMAWFASIPASALCPEISSASNSTYALFAEAGPVTCGTPPAAGAASSSISFSVASRQVTLIAWSGAVA